MHPTFDSLPTGPRRLICYPYAGAGASAYSGWRRKVPELDFIIARLPGRDGLFRTPAITDFWSLIQYLLDEIWPLSYAPFALFGHSMGGLLAYELSRQLGDTGRPPALLIVSATDAPQNFDISRKYGDALDDASLLAAMRSNGGMPDEGLRSEELLKLMIPVMRSDIQMLATYKYIPSPSPLGIPTVLYYGADDEPDPDGLRREWEVATGDCISTYEFPGDHFFLHSARDAVIRTLARHIDEAITAS
jgi:surfactin synthase thioesterase subunit